MTLQRKLKFSVILAVVWMGGSLLLASDPPALPSGLGSGPAVPALPSGLGGKAESPDGEKGEVKERLFPFSGFVEMRAGGRLKDAPGFSDTSLAEVRTQLQWEGEVGAALLEATVDLLYDAEAESREFDWERGDGWLDVRNLSATFQLGDQVDVKAGRQVATWGVGDLLFINDLFPKDWNAFFLGRDLEYLKAPQDSVRVSYFQDWANVELIYSPRFESDRYIDGDRLVYWNAGEGRLTRWPAPLAVEVEDGDEWHGRISRMVGSYELAGYGYWGFWKSPAGMDTGSGRSIFPGLNVFGVSARGPLGKGVLSVELGSYESRWDEGGDDPAVRNSELRWLLGYEQELASELTGSVQYYVERTRDFATSGSVGERDRELVTVRLSKPLWRQTLMLSAFAFYSPSQEDGYTRLSASWKASDEWRWDVGANIFSGEQSSFFGQFGRNENGYLAVRRVF